MRALAVLAIALAAYAVGRAAGSAIGRREAAEPLPSDVQRDPWPDEVLANVTLATGGPLRVTLPPDRGCEYLMPRHGTGDVWPLPSVVTLADVADPTYLEATALAAVRRSAQSPDRPTEGMS